MSRVIFYSWQSDLPNKNNRNFIEKSIKQSIKALVNNNEIKIFMDYDRDTYGLTGSPDISNTIFEKINNSSLFVCDVSIINAADGCRKCPNPNVMIELGYAVKVLGWERVICFFNLEYGKIDDLPFDLRQKRILAYDCLKENEQKRVVSMLEENIKVLFAAGKLFNPLNDYMKGKIDKCFLDILIGVSNILFGTVSLSEGLQGIKNTLNLSINDIENAVQSVTFPGFLALNTYSETRNELINILNNLLTSNYFPRDWAVIVLRILDWIRIYQNVTSQRYTPSPIKYLIGSVSNKYAVVSGYSINPQNPVDSKIVLEVIYEGGKKYIDSEKGKVINKTNYSVESFDVLHRMCRYNNHSYAMMAKIFYEIIDLGNKWMEFTGNEFVLDPDIYQIK